MKTYLLITSFLFLCLGVEGQNSLSLQQVATNVAAAVDIAHAEDERLFIVQKLGRIRTIAENGNLLGYDFLNITDRIEQSNIWSTERGLLSLAFHPNYTQNGFFYVFYTNKNSNGIRISRFSVTNFDRNKADASSEKIILSIPHSAKNHLGGDIAFGNDGYLYITIGDAIQSENVSQDLNSFLGKILRIDVDGGNPYAIPNDNPYKNTANKGEIWASGLRNPWRFSFDRLTDDLWVSDVGADARDEINFQAANSAGGTNYGWKCHEGSQRNEAEECGEGNLVFPVYEYSPLKGQPCKSSVTGGFVYRGSKLDELYGKYIYGDFCTGDIWALSKQNNNWNNQPLHQFGEAEISTFGEDADGELYFAAYNEGAIYQLVDLVNSTKEDNISSSKFNIIPNPVQDKLWIESRQVSKKINFEVVNALGQSLLSSSLYFGATTAEVNVSTLPVGYYWGVFSDGIKVQVVAFVKI